MFDSAYTRDECCQLGKLMPKLVIPVGLAFKPCYADRAYYRMLFYLTEDLNSEEYVSCYLDCKNTLGLGRTDYDGEHFKPSDCYWEIYPYEDGIRRYGLHDTLRMFADIETELKSR